ncbi:MAG: DUF4402 domain-containing protein [Rhodospirillales bacterium]|nr:DUF4402 domain-containing protein [Rhodospirillales bacterium]
MSQLSKKVLGTGAAVVALSAFVPNPFMIGDAMAQATASDTMNITAKIVNPMDVNQLVKLNFGSIAVGAAASAKVVLPATGAAAVTAGDAVLIAGQAAGKVSFNAPSNQTFTISVADLATKAIFITAGATTAASKTMKVDQLFLKASGTKISIGGGTAATLKVGGTSTSAKITGGTAGNVNIGGRLISINPNQLVGTYTGTYKMSVTL